MEYQWIMFDKFWWNAILWSDYSRKQNMSDFFFLMNTFWMKYSCYLKMFLTYRVKEVFQESILFRLITIKESLFSSFPDLCFINVTTCLLFMLTKLMYDFRIKHGQVIANLVFISFNCYSGVTNNWYRSSN